MMKLAVTFPPRLYPQGFDPTTASLSDIPILIGNLIQILLAIGAVWAVIAIILAAIKFSTSQGDSGRIKSAENSLTAAITGLILSAAAYLLVDFVAGRFG